MKKPSLIPTALVFLISIPATAQFGEIRGTITDKETGQQLPGATVSYEIAGKQSGTIANEKGEYILKPLAPGTYDVTFSFVTYNKQTVNSVVVSAEKTTFVNASLSANTNLPIVDVFWEPSLVDPGNVQNMTTLTTTQIEQSVDRDPVSLVSATPGVFQKEEGGTLNIRGSRDGDTMYLVDGIRMSPPISIPKSAIAEISVLTGGIPAQFGNATGGVVIITTKSYGWMK